MADRNKLHYETVTPLLKETLGILMKEELFAPFRLIGGTNLSLRYGHRKSEDIDLFTDAEYRSLDFRPFEQFLQSRFTYYNCSDKGSLVAFGRTYYIGNSADNAIKLDLMYTDPFLEKAEVIDGVRMASVRDIVAMKMNVVSRGGRKKDFWDLHMLLGHYTLKEMFGLHERRHPWEHNAEELLDKFTDFSFADVDLDPICLRNMDWDNIKLDLIDTAEEFGSSLQS